jgi:hypothetical protein
VAVVAGVAMMVAVAAAEAAVVVVIRSRRRRRRSDLPLSGVLAISDPLRLLVNKSICVVKSNIS